MTYRNFVRPAMAKGSATVGGWLDWMGDQGDILVPVAPHHALSCTRCYGASRFRGEDRDETWPECWECGRVYGDVVDTFVPITYSLDAGLESMLHQYKDQGAAWLRRPLASLLTAFIHRHADCIDDDAHGVDIATTVPANDPHRTFDHLEGLIQGTIANDPVLQRFDWQLDAIARDASFPRPGRQSLSPEAYRVDPGHVDGAAVLLLDDTWTSGASASSAAAALKAAGAAHVTVLTLGRQLNPNHHFGSTEAICEDRLGAKWSLDECVLCA